MQDEGTGMPLEIEFLRALYDDERDIVTFMGMDGARLVRCSVTRDALRALSRRRAESAKEMLEAYRTHASSTTGLQCENMNSASLTTTVRYSCCSGMSL
jgi:hypothetical protein